ncbi:hypothetical protein V6N13_129875 [Hibiscus sabdariffa]
MERSEAALLVPEWLRTTGTVTGGGNSNPHFASSSSNSYASCLTHHGRQGNSRNISDFGFPLSAFLDRSSSLNLRSSANGSAKHAYSACSMSHRDKDRERDKERSSFGNHWACDSSDCLESFLASRVEKLGGISTIRVEIDKLRRSHYMVHRKQREPLHRRVAVDSRDIGNSNHYNGNDLLSGGTVGSSINKAVFEKNFPSLGTEERQGVPEIARVSSPGFSSASQSLPVGNSALIGVEGWSSARTDVPSVAGSGGTGSLTATVTVSTSGSGSPRLTAGLNMAEALAQYPSQTHTAPQSSVKTQRCEELAIKQSRQLIPVTPSMSKGSVLNSVDKSKAKPAGRTIDMSMTIKNGQQQYGNQSSHSGHVKSDTPKTSGKLLVLKPGWENGVSSPTQKDVASPAKNANSKVATSEHAVTSASARNSNHPKLSAGERKTATLNPIAGFTLEKRPSLAQTRSRNDFFNLLKKKTSTKGFAGLSDSDPHISSSIIGKSEVPNEVARVSAPAHDEEEVAFLRSLGWEENSGEDEGLTEEEINAFYQEYMKLRPSLEPCRTILPKLTQSCATNLDGASSESSSTNPISQA